MLMTPASRADAQKRVDDIHVFRRELASLEREGIVALTEAQQRGIADHHAGLLDKFSSEYDIDRDAQASQLSLGMRIASFLGALAMGASVFLLFYQFWGYFPTAVQVAVLVLAPLGAFLATMWIGSKDASGYFTKLAAIVAFACFVLNLVMLGQIFNITPSDNAFIAWAALALLLAYTYDIRLLLAAGIICIIAFVSARTGTWSGMYWLHFGERPENFFPVAVALFCVPLWISHARFAGFAVIYRVFALLALFLPMLVLANWGQASYLRIDRDAVEGMYQILGFAGSAGAIWLGVRRNWPDTVNTGITFFVIFLYTKMFDWWWSAMPKYLFFMVLALTSILLLLVLRRMRSAAYKLLGGAAR